VNRLIVGYGRYRTTSRLPPHVGQTDSAFLSRSRPARPYMSRLSILQILPSTGGLLAQRVSLPVRR
jgi:hypothetical protein